MSTQATTELPPRYDAAAVQAEVARVWDDERLFHAEPTDDGEPFCVVIPPPNVTAKLHLGHAFNNTIQDILVRHARMQGKNAVWIPGTDHAGIATQTVVEKRLLQTEGKRRTDYTRDEFVAKVQAWKDEYEQVILGQLKAMGCSCDYERTAFTMDEQRSKAVREAFFRLFKDGLIYRGKRLVNWDPATQTALADDEVENEEIDGHFYYLKYPLAQSRDREGAPPATFDHPHDQNPPVTLPYSRGSGRYITVATTRPETMLGDTAVAINPKDPRAGALRGMKVVLPIVGREIPIVEDDYVVMPGDEDDPKAKFATGFLKVTPAHDPNDWDIGQRHDLEVINTMAPDASISDAHGWTPETEEAKEFVGLSREAARERVVAWFKEHGLLEKVVPYRHSVGHSYRSHVPVEPYLSDQWYVAVQKPIPWMEDAGVVEGTDVPANSLAGLALTALPQSRDREGASPVTPDLARDLDAPEALPHGRGSGTGVPLAHFITFTTYGTRLHGAAAGSIDPAHNRFGDPIPLGNKDLEASAGARMKSPPVELDEPRRRAVREAILEVCDYRGWSLVALHVRTSHVHVIVSGAAEPERMMNDFKSYATRRLRHGKLVDESAKVWTRHGSTRYLWLEQSVVAAVDYVVDEQGVFLPPGPTQSRDHQGAPPTTPDLASDPNAPEALPHGRGSGSSYLGDDVLTFVPERYAKTYRQWNAALRDWCISRQLWWGHRIPVWSVQREAHLRCEVVVPELDGSEEGDLSEASYFSENWLAEHRARRTGSHSWEENIVPRNDENTLQVEEELVDSGKQQDPDVLDTWFSSALWPMSTLGWPNKTPELELWNPTSVLCTAREIITLWVSRMVMFNRYMLAHPDEERGARSEERGGDQTSDSAPRLTSHSSLPFKDVFIHAMIQDGHGQKMSKSLGNGVDPLDIIDSHGADAMRFTLAGMATHTQDVRLPVDSIDPHTGETFTPQTFTNASGYVVAKPIQEHNGKQSVSGYGLATGEATPSDDVPLARNTSSKFDLGRNFCNKLWNASRFVIGSLSRVGFSPPPDAVGDDADGGLKPTLLDRWILSRLSQTVQACDEAIADYRFDRYTTALYDFFWRDFCDWYVESTKPRTKADDPTAKQVLATCLDWSLRLLHPAVPFATERLWWSLNEAAPERGIGDFKCEPNERLIKAKWPTDLPATDEAAITQVDRLRDFVLAVRQLRADHKVEPRRTVPVCLRGVELSADEGQALETWANAELVDEATASTAAASAKVGDVDILVGGIIDKAADAARHDKERAALEKQVKALKGRLANKGYTDKAPPHLVQETRDQLAAAEEQLAAL